MKAGGRVVKNVAGYDLMKLQIGAVGTLGVVTQVTLKVKPKPEASAAVLEYGMPSGRPRGPYSIGYTRRRTRPVAVELSIRQPTMRPVWVHRGRLRGEGTWRSTGRFRTLLDELQAVSVTDVSAMRDEDARASAAERRPRNDSRLLAPDGDGLSFKANMSRQAYSRRFCNDAPRMASGSTLMPFPESSTDTRCPTWRRVRRHWNGSRLSLPRTVVI